MELNLYSEVIKFLVVFIRVTSAVINFPIISTKYIFKRETLSLCIMFTIALFPTIRPYLEDFFQKSNAYLLILMSEILIGIIITIGAKFYLYIAYIIDYMISSLSLFGAVSLFDNSQKINISLFGNFLIMNIILIAFILDIHHIFIKAIVLSYQKFPVGEFVEQYEVSKYVVTMVNSSFVLAFKISAPFFVVNILFSCAGSILSKLVPNFQVFFVMMPLQILATLFTLYIVNNNLIYKVVNLIKDSFIFLL